VKKPTIYTSRPFYMKLPQPLLWRIAITGISSGFGKQTAELLTAAGHTVYGTVRRDVEISPAINGLKT